MNSSDKYEDHSPAQPCDKRIMISRMVVCSDKDAGHGKGSTI